jgi:hypothetical protein
VTTEPTHEAIVTHWSHGRPTIRLADGREFTAVMGSRVRGKLDVDDRVNVVLSPDGSAARVVARMVEVKYARVKASERRRRFSAGEER